LDTQVGEERVNTACQSNQAGGAPKREGESVAAPFPRLSRTDAQRAARRWFGMSELQAAEEVQEPLRRSDRLDMLQLALLRMFLIEL
jgi:hypothetical protein